MWSDLFTEHAHPTVTRDSDGFLTLNWPADGPDTAIVSREVLEDYVSLQNEVTQIRNFFNGGHSV